MDIRALLMGLAFALMWSSAFTSSRIIVQDAPPMMALAIRFLISGGIAILLAWAMGQRIRLNRAQWSATVIFGVCQNALYLGCFFIAMQWIEASLAAIIASTMPLLVALFAWVFQREKIRPLAVIGLITGFAGVALIMGGRLSSGSDIVGLAFCAVGVVALTIATMSAKGAMSGGNVLLVVGLQMLIGSAVLWPPALLLETWDVVWTPKLGAAFAYTIFVPGLIATWVWFQLVGRIGATKAAAFHFLNPFFGVAIAALLLGESLGAWDYVGVVIIAAGVLAVQISKQRI